MLITNEFKSLENVMSTLSTAPKECVYGLVNESDKKIQVFSTGNFLSHISKLIQELGSLNNKAIKDDLNNLKLVVLETDFPNKLSRNNKYKQLVQKYKNLGYEFYNELSVVQYSLRETYRYKNHKAYYVVELVSGKKCKAILVGAFSKYREARAFQAKYYKDGMITSVVVADTPETKIWEADY